MTNVELTKYKQGKEKIKLSFSNSDVMSNNTIGDAIQHWSNTKNLCAAK